MRLACLAATSALFAATPPGAVSEVVAPGVRLLCADRTPAVRAAFHAALAGWITAKGRHVLGATPANATAATNDDSSAPASQSAGSAVIGRGGEGGGGDVAMTESVAGADAGAAGTLAGFRP